MITPERYRDGPVPAWVHALTSTTVGTALCDLEDPFNVQGVTEAETSCLNGRRRRKIRQGTGTSLAYWRPNYGEVPITPSFGV